MTKYLSSHILLSFGLLIFFSPLLPVFGQAGSSDAERRLQELRITLTEPNPPMAEYVPAVRTGNLIFLSGHGPRKATGELVTGKVGAELDLAAAQEAAKLAGIALLSALKAEIGDLNKVRRIVKVLGIVNATADFTDQPQVINGFSELMVEVFGDKGKHARSAVGAASLPGNMAVEIEMIVEVEN